MANTDGIFGTTASLNGSGALDVVAAEELRRVQQEKANLEASASAESRAEPVFMPPSRADFEQQYFQKQIENKNFDVFNKKPDVLDRIVSQAYQEEVQRAQASFEASSASQAPAPLPPAAPPSVQTASSNEGILYNQQNALVRGYGAGYSQYAQSYVEPVSSPQVEEYLPPRPPLARGGNVVRWAGPGRSAFPQVIASAAPALISAYPAIIGDEDQSGGPRGSAWRGAAGSPGGQTEGGSGDSGGGDGADAADAPSGDSEQTSPGGSVRPAVGPGAAGRFWGRLRGVGAHALANMKEDWEDPSGYGKLNYGYALQQIGQETGQYYEKTQAGQYLTPEQKATAAAGFLPGAGALAGVAIGGMIAPGVGSWVGGMVGGGIAAAAQGVVGANDERGQATREAAERLAASLGQAAETVGTFKSQLEATGAPIASLSQGLSALQATGPGVGAAAVAGAARSALSEGEYYGADTAATAKFLASDPALAPLAQTYRTHGELSRQSFQSIAQLALAEGDTGEFNAAQMQASRATLNSDPQYQALAKNQQADASSWGNQINHWTAEAGHHLGFQWLGMSDEDPIVQDQLRLDRRKAEVDKQNGLDAQKDVDEFAAINKGRQGLIDAGLNVKIGQAGLATAEATGGGAAALRRLAPGVAASYDAASAADQTLIATDTGLMNAQTDATDPTGSIRAAYQTLINRARADQAGNPLAKAQLARSVFDAGLQEDESAYGLDIAGRQGGLTRGLLSGRSYDQLAGDEYGIISSQNARAARLRRDATNPINDPARRDQMLAEATSLETQAAVSRHDFQQDIERQTLGGLDVRVAGAAQQVGQAQAFSTPGEVYSAQGQELDALRAKFGELTSELRLGGLTVDEQRQKESELIQVRGQAVQVAAQQRDERIANNRGFAEDDVTLATAGIGRQVRQGGSAAVNAGAVGAAYDGTLASDRDAISRYAPGTRERRDAEARLASDTARKADALDSLNVYAPSAATRLGDAEGQASLRRAQTAFSLEEISPYRSGAPGSSPFTAALGLESALKGDLALQGRDQAAADAFRASRQKSGQWDDVAEAGYAADKERRDETVDSDRLRMGQLEHDRQFEMLRALPLMIAGGGGMQGVSSGVVGFDALTADFTPNALQGSWGKPANVRGAARPGSVPGDAYDGFQAHATSSPAAPASLTATLQTLAHGLNTQQLAGLLQQMLAELRTLSRNSGAPMRGQAGPPQTSLGGASQALGQAINTNRPSQR